MWNPDLRWECVNLLLLQQTPAPAERPQTHSVAFGNVCPLPFSPQLGDSAAPAPRGRQPGQGWGSAQTQTRSWPHQTRCDLHILSQVMAPAEEKHRLKLLLSLLLPVYEAGLGYTDVSGGTANAASALAPGTAKIREHELSNHISVPISSLAIRERRKTISGKGSI